MHEEAPGRNKYQDPEADTDVGTRYYLPKCFLIIIPIHILYKYKCYSSRECMLLTCHPLFT